ncbi:MAG: hypothetical protein JWO09_769 [Bacteroidetes bacterium]|nr:hypothetical protein [Bacteroidota bacterium]
MADTTNSESQGSAFKPNFSSELNIESLISAPLIAASKANVAMVTGQARFLLEYCFEKNEKTNTHEPKMITMSLSKGIINSSKNPGDADYIRLETINFTLPLLCIIPLSSIAVDKVTIDFDMEITSVTSYESESGILEKRAILNGKISNSSQENTDSSKNQYKSQSSSKLKVNVNAGPLPLPLGILTILDMYNKAIQPSPVEKK